MQSTGQTSTHASQPVQLSALMTAISLKNFFFAGLAPAAGGALATAILAPQYLETDRPYYRQRSTIILVRLCPNGEPEGASFPDARAKFATSVLPRCELY